jgi:hypothetical protein
MRRPKPHKPGLEVGDVVLVRGETTNAQALFVVVATVEAWPPGNENPVVASLLWEGADVPSPDEMKRLPLLHDDKWHGLGLDRPDWGRAYEVSLHGVWNPSRGQHALTRYREVVARGVYRTDDVRRRGTGRGGRLRRFTRGRIAVAATEIGHCNWTFLAGWIEGEWYARCGDLTKRLYGLD